VYLVQAGAGGLAERIGAAVGSGADRAGSWEPVLEWLKDRVVLLVVDGGAGEPSDVDLVAAILSNAPHVTMLVPASAPLDLLGEWLVDVAEPPGG
jgi:hypothetical protein